MMKLTTFKENIKTIIYQLSVGDLVGVRVFVKDVVLESSSSREVIYLIKETIFHRSSYFPWFERIVSNYERELYCGVEEEYSWFGTICYNEILPKILNLLEIIFDSLLQDFQIEKIRTKITGEKNTLSYYELAKRNWYNLVLGKKEIILKNSLSQITTKNIRELLHRWFSPQNVLLVIVGGYKCKEKLPLFSNNIFSSQKNCGLKCSISKIPQGKQFVGIKRNIENPEICVGFVCDREKIVFLKLINVLLRNFLYEMGTGVCWNIDTEVRIFSQFSTLLFQFGVLPDKEEELIKRLIHFTSRNITFNKKEIFLAKRSCQLELSYIAEEIEPSIRFLGECNLYGKTFVDFDYFLKQIKHINKEQIEDFAKNAFTYSNVFVSYVGQKVTSIPRALKEIGQCFVKI